MSFLCIHNAGRSLATKVLLDQYSQVRVGGFAISRRWQSDPGSSLRPFEESDGGARLAGTT